MNVDNELDSVQVPSPDLHERLQADIEAAGGEVVPDAACAGAIGVTLFDVPGSEDHTVTVVLPRENAERAPSQTLVRIHSRDGRKYVGMVTAGPFAEPDSLRGDAPVLITATARGGTYQPPYHGRLQVTILGEELEGGSMSPPRLRPLPNSPVVPLQDSEAAELLKAAGDMRLGLVVGFDNVPICVPSSRKDVLPRHTAVLGTTGGGKSTTIARLVQQAQAAGMAVILLDVEGEYTQLHRPTTNQSMLDGLAKRGLTAAGIPPDTMTVYHLVGREPANPDHPQVRPFSLQFAYLSPFAAAEILGLSEAQEDRFRKAYDIAKEVMRDLQLFPAKGDAEQERLALEYDEFVRGYPRLTLSFLMDIVAKGLKLADKDKESAKSDFIPFNESLGTAAGKSALDRRTGGKRFDSAVSWGALLGRLARLQRLKVFDSPEKLAKPLNYKSLLRPGKVSVIDLSDSGMSELNSIVIADLLRGVQEAQDEAYGEHERAKKEGRTATPLPRTLIIIEEAHEFLSEERIDKMKILFEQVARIAKRGRKRWLGLVFVTQLPQHLPRQVFGLVNSYLLHKISDPQVVSTLKRTVSGIDESLWQRLPGLAPGQAIVSFPHMARPLLVSIDPTPAELRMVD